AGDLGHAGDHHPVLGALVVLLQAQRRAGLDHDALDLEALAGIDGVVVAPGPVDLAVEGVLLAPGLLDAVDDVLDVLDPVLARDQGRVGGVHDDHVVDADGRDHPAVGRAHEVVPAIEREHVALVAVAVGVVLGGRPQRGPGADVAPAAADWDHGGAGGLLHHRVVDRIARA